MLIVTIGFLQDVQWIPEDVPFPLSLLFLLLWIGAVIATGYYGGRIYEEQFCHVVNNESRKFVSYRLCSHLVYVGHLVDHCATCLMPTTLTFSE